MRYSLGVIVSLLLFLSACSSTPGVTPMNPSTPYPPSTSMVTGNPAIHDEDTVIPGFSDSGGVFPSEDTVVVKPPIYEPLILGTGSLRTKLYVVDDILVLHTADDAPREVGKWRDDFRVVDTAKGYYTIGKKLYFVSKEEPLGKYEPRKIKRYPCVGGIELDKKFYVYGKEYTTRKLPVNKRCEAIGLSDGSGVYIAEYPES